MAPPVRRAAGPAGRTTAKAAGGAPLTDSAPGGGLDDIDALLVSHQTINDYEYKDKGGPTGKTSNGLIVEIEYVDAEGQKQVVEQFYSSGKARATEDGTGFDTTPKDSCKAKIYIMALVELFGGIKNAPDVGSDVRVFDGIKAHLNNRALPKMGFEEAGDRPKTCLIATEIISMPGQKSTVPTGRTAGARPTVPTGTASRGAQRATQQDNGEPAEGDLDTTVMQLVYDALSGANGNALTRQKLAGTVWLTAKNNKDADASNYRGIAGNQKWLEEHAEEGGWQVEGDQISLAS